MQAWVIGNWKQNPATISDVDTLLNTLVNAVTNDTATRMTHCQLMIAPSCIHLAAVQARLQDTSILCAAQDIGAHSASTGAYTGDCSAQQVADAGATWTILGHSERRQYYKESHSALVHKVNHALTKNLGVILCIGETQTQYDDQQTLAILNTQLLVIKEVLAAHPDLAESLGKRLIIAYEPVWAIGTGQVPTVAEVTTTHKHIKQTVATFANQLSNISVLYGGSVNADNADSFAASPMIDGALVGGASLKADSFLAIADAFNKAKNEHVESVSVPLV